MEYGIESIVPAEKQQNQINELIFKELGKGMINNSSKTFFLDVINNLASDGTEGIILGCTEIPLIILQADTSVRIYDTSQIHAARALEFALSEI